MSRSGYDYDGEDNWATIRWRGMVASAARGRRGQAFFRDMLAALDAMPEKRLIAGEFVAEDGACCALGSLALARGWDDARQVDSEDHEELAGRFDVATCLVREVEAENDETLCGMGPEERWRGMRAWVASQVKEAK